MHFLADLFKQGQADHFFQLFDLHGNARLAQVQFLSCTGVTKVSCGRLEYPELSEGDIQGHETISFEKVDFLP
ncbi:hypothetical protein BMS3Bbin11_01858 [bacterium BMS3Bbin11]|nr:hypothetical protein BMS3Bbin11_01858 [bacterium BMS3Bbin11]